MDETADKLVAVGYRPGRKVLLHEAGRAAGGVRRPGAHSADFLAPEQVTAELLSFLHPQD